MTAFWRIIPVPVAWLCGAWLCGVLLVGGASARPLQPGQAVAGLAYDALAPGPVPIPPAERALQTATAAPWFRVSGDNRVLEGAVFDHKGRLLLCDVTGRRVLRLTPQKQLSTVVTLKELAPGGLAFHPDGRLFMAALNLDTGRGAIVALPAARVEAGQATSADVQAIIPPQAGYLPNDLVFDAAGGFYFTDFKGTATDALGGGGGVYHVAAGSGVITPVLRRLAQANGLALSPDGGTLWATEFGRNLLHRVELADATTPTVTGSSVPYHFTGPAPDSMRVDADGNVYVAVYGQGRVLAFNSRGIPLGQIVLPGRQEGRNLLSTSLAIRPGERDLYVVSGNSGSAGESPAGASVFKTRALGRGLPPAAGK